MTRSKLLPGSQCRELPARPISTYETERVERLRAELRRDKIFFRVLLGVAIAMLFVFPYFAR